MSVKITRLEYVTADFEKHGGYQVRIGKGKGKSLYCGDTKCGGKRGAKRAADEVGEALTILTRHFPDLIVGREKNDSHR